MGFLLNDETYFASFWFVAFNGFDYMGAVFKVGKPEDQQTEWEFLYRFRYYTADPVDPFTDDEKHWQGWKVKGDTPEAELEAKVQETVDHLVELYRQDQIDAGNEPWCKKFRVPIHGTGDKAMQELTKHRWFHAKQEPTTSLPIPKQHLGH